MNLTFNLFFNNHSVYNFWLIDEEKSDDVEFIKYSTKYGTALRALQEYKKVEANKDLLKYWQIKLQMKYQAFI